MTPDRASRHAGQPTYSWPISPTEEVELYQPRLRTTPPAVRVHTVRGADRLDLVAHRYLDDPHRYWCIADANPETDLDALVEPGRRLRIPRRPA